MKISPLGDRAVIEPIEEDEKSAAGIVIPDTASKERPQKGKVLAVGPGKLGDDNERVKPEVKDGDTVLFSWPSRNKLLDYISDRESALWSRDALETALDSLGANPNVGRVHIVAHSMGSMLTVEGLRQLHARHGDRLADEAQHVPLHAVGADHSAGRPAHRFQHRALFDVELEVGPRPAGVERAPGLRHAVDVDAVLGQRVGEAHALTVAQVTHAVGHE